MEPLLRSWRIPGRDGVFDYEKCLVVEEHTRPETVVVRILVGGETCSVYLSRDAFDALAELRNQIRYKVPLVSQAVDGYRKPWGGSAQ